MNRDELIKAAKELIVKQAEELALAGQPHGKLDLAIEYLQLLTQGVDGNEIDPIVVCGDCGCACEATVKWEQQEIPHGDLGSVTARFPAWTCNNCGFQWTGPNASEMRDQAVADAKKAMLQAEGKG